MPNCSRSAREHGDDPSKLEHLFLLQKKELKSFISENPEVGAVFLFPDGVPKRVVIIICLNVWLCTSEYMIS